MRRKGVVFDQQGHPVAGALVYVVSGSADFPEIALESDAQGRFTLSLQPGEFCVEAVADSGRRGQSEIVQHPAEVDELIEIVLEEDAAENGS